jgi:hypothetical protein
MRRNGPKSSIFRNATPGRSLRRFWTPCICSTIRLSPISAQAPGTSACELQGASRKAKYLPRTRQWLPDHGLQAWQKHPGIVLGRGVIVLREAERFKYAESGSILPRKIRSPIGRRRKSFTLSASVALTQIRVPSSLLAASSRGAILMVSP